MQVKKRKFIYLSQAAKITSYSSKHLNHLVRSKKLKGVKMGRNWMTTEEWIEEYQRGRNETDRNMISLSQAAKMTGYSSKHLNHLVRSKKLKGVKMGRNWMTTKEWVEEYIQENKKTNFVYKKVEISFAPTKEPKLKFFLSRKFLVPMAIIFLFVGVVAIGRNSSVRSLAKQMFDSEMLNGAEKLVCQIFPGFEKNAANFLENISKINRQIDLACDNFVGRIPQVTEKISNKLGDAYLKMVEYLVPGYSLEEKSFVLSPKTQKQETTAVVEEETTVAPAQTLVIEQTYNPTQIVVKEVVSQSQTQPHTITETTKRIIETVESADLSLVKADISRLSQQIVSLGSQIGSKINYAVPSYAPVYIPSAGIEVSGHSLLSTLNVSGSGAIGGSLAVKGNTGFGSPLDTTDTMTVDSDATFNNPITVAKTLTAADGVNVTGGSLTVGAFSVNSATGSVTGNLSITGNVGIGTTTPGSAFVVTAPAGNYAGDQALFTVASTTNETSDDILVVTADGNVGIGTTTPDSKLAVSGKIHAVNSSEQLRLSHSDLANKYASFTVDSNGDLTINTGGSAAVATTTFTDILKLTYAPQTAGVANLHDSPLYIDSDSTGPVADANLFVIANDGSYRFRVDAEGDVFVKGNITTEGVVTQSGTDITGNLTVEGYSLLGDAPNNDYLEIKGYTTIRATSTNPALMIDQGSTGGLLTMEKDGSEVFTIDNNGNATTTGGTFSIIDSSESSYYKVGQANENSIHLGWIYNATAANGYGVISAYANSNPIYYAAQSHIFSNGQVGIATTTPWAHLSIEGQGTNPAFVVSDTSNNTDFIVDASGNVGIGTTSPIVSLVINDTDAILMPVGTTAQRPTTVNTGMMRFNSSNSQFEGYNGSVWSGLGGVTDVDQNTYILAESVPGGNEDTLYFYTGGAEKMRIDNAGNVGIGTTTPWGKLSVHSASANTAPLFVVASSTPNLVGTTTAFIINKDGNVGIGTTTPNAKLTVIGKIHASSTSEQLRLSYDDSTNAYASFTAESDGDLIVDLATDTATTTFYENVAIVGNLGGGSPLDIVTDVNIYGTATVTDSLYANTLYENGASLASKYIAAPVSPATGGILYYTGAAWAALTPGTSGYALLSQGAGNAPVYSKVSYTGGITFEDADTQAASINGKSTAEGALILRTFDIAFAAQVINSSNLTVANAASILNHEDIATSTVASIFDSSNLSAAKAASIVDSSNLSTTKTVAAINDSNLTTAKTALIIDNDNLSLEKALSILSLSNLTADKIQSIMQAMGSYSKLMDLILDGASDTTFSASDSTTGINRYSGLTVNGSVTLTLNGQPNIIIAETLTNNGTITKSATGGAGGQAPSDPGDGGAGGGGALIIVKNLDNNSTIQANGVNGVSGSSTSVTGNGSAGTSGSAISRIGSDAIGAGGNGGYLSSGGAGLGSFGAGGGGYSSANKGGDGGAVTYTTYETAANLYGDIRNATVDWWIESVLSGSLSASTTFESIIGSGSGGGGGSEWNTVSENGGGGGSGGQIIVLADIYDNTGGTVAATGGNGGNEGAEGNDNGGGGGGGGLVYGLYRTTLTGTGTLSAAGGTQGSSNNTSATAGSAGTTSTNSVSGADLAENYPTVPGETVQPGDVVSIASADSSNMALLLGELEKINLQGGLLESYQTIGFPSYAVTKTKMPYDNAVLGIVSINPAIVIGPKDAKSVPIALAGRVPVKIDSDSEPINPGDYLTSSDRSGYAMKATQAGQIIGKALDFWNHDKEQVLAFVSLQWVGSEYYLKNNKTRENLAVKILDALNLNINKLMPEKKGNDEEATSTEEIITEESKLSIFDKFALLVETTLSELGLSFENGIAHFREVVAEKITIQENPIAAAAVMNTSDISDISKIATTTLEYGNLLAFEDDNGFILKEAATTDSDLLNISVSFNEIDDLAVKNSLFVGSSFSIDSNGSINSKITGISERYSSEEELEIGDVAVFDLENSLNIKKATSSYQSNLIGVVSDQSGLSLGEGRYAVISSGRALAKVIGLVNIGDQLTSASSTPGYAIKATQAGQIIGYALEKSETATGSVMMFVKPGWQPGLSLTEMEEKMEKDSLADNQSGVFEEIISVLEKLGLIVKNGIAYIAEIIADKITTKELCLDDVCINKEQLKQLLESNQIDYQKGENQIVDNAKINLEEAATTEILELATTTPEIATTTPGISEKTNTAEELLETIEEEIIEEEIIEEKSIDPVPAEDSVNEGDSLIEE